MSDTIADMLTSIRNANRALLPEVQVPHSNIKESIAKVLHREGYVADVQVEGTKVRKIKVKLKYDGRRGVITDLKRVSKPGLRHYVGATEIPRVRAGLGTAVVSTSQGIMSGNEARKKNLGGELVCFVW